MMLATSTNENLRCSLTSKLTRDFVKTNLIIVLGVCCWISMPAGKNGQLCADVFQMKDGRTISGSAMFISGRKAYLVEISDDIKVLVPENQIESHRKSTDKMAEYEAKLGELENSLAGHSALAAWCHKNGLPANEKAHYERMLDFEPDHAVARAALGYRRDKSNQWVRIEKVMSGQRGMVRDGNKWTFPELRDMKEQADELETAVKQRGREIRRWHNEANTDGTKSQAALLKLRQINDPLAIAELAELLRSNIRPEFKLLYIELLKNMNIPAAAQAIANASMLDADSRIRQACHDALLSMDNGKAIGRNSYLGYLHDKDPARIDRAAEGLSVLGDQSAILPLIEALVTTRTVSTPAGPGISTGMGTGNGGISMGGRPKSISVRHESRTVLAALTQLTSAIFGFDQNKWRAWYAEKYAPPMGDLRRDP